MNTPRNNWGEQLSIDLKNRREELNIRVFNLNKTGSITHNNRICYHILVKSVSDLKYNTIEAALTVLVPDKMELI